MANQGWGFYGRRTELEDLRSILGRGRWFFRVTDTLDLDHLDIESILEILAIHADLHPQRLLFLWNLFERTYRSWHVQKVAIAPTLDDAHRRALEQSGYLPQDLGDLTRGLVPEGLVRTA